MGPKGCVNIVPHYLHGMNHIEKNIVLSIFPTMLISTNKWQSLIKRIGIFIYCTIDDPNYAINLSCNEGHQPYPRGICSKCQPPPITLQLQKFRMIDHLEYANHSILNDFINVWRVSGVQRFGYLYGRYEKFDKVPMGIKAVVEAIVEPPQLDELDGITLLEWPDEQLVDEIAAKLGIYKVGIVFTDLTDLGQKMVLYYARDIKIVTS